jgi:hypothetical protein
MIISHLYKLVFIHIPKTAGSYIENILHNIDPDCVDIDFYEKNNLYGHIPFYLIKQMDIYKDISEYKFFTVIREPIDLIISHYNYILSCKNLHYLYERMLDKSLCESINIILNDNPNLSFYYITNNYNNDPEYLYNDINKKIEFLKFDNISFNFKQFLIKVKIPLNIIDKFFNDDIVNKSNKFINNVDIINIDEGKKKIIELNKKFYDSL